MTFTIPVANNSSGMPWPAGLYEITCTGIEPDDRVSKFGDTPRVKFSFSVDKVIRITPVADQALNAENRAKAQKAKAEGADLVGWCNLTMGRKATMRSWIEALLGRQLANGEGVNPSDVIGKRAEATLETYTGDDGSEKVKIGSLAPLGDGDQPF